MVKCHAPLFALMLFACNLGAQSEDCTNAGFELGTSEGYDTYTGFINGEGQVVVRNPVLDVNRHKVVHISEGYDSIAANFCFLNQLLPVVPPGGGQFAMRLGNANKGAEAEKVVLRFKVTPDLTFFLLRYAVVLNDPNHLPFQQPRFELRILDENGEVFPCGEYKVRAAADIEGFENCGDWRVRPWTTAGFELQSFLGQNIQIEILTTDCSEGAHSGYAYFDASCKPLEINLDGYCPGTTSATLKVTEGFERYRWSTGHSTSEIEIFNPEPGQVYSVTVTSATGCMLTLTDTIPPFEEVPVPMFVDIPDTTICAGNQILVEPKGVNLTEIFSPEAGYASDFFLLAPDTTTTYTFYSSDAFGCQTASVSFTIRVDSISNIIQIPVVDIDSTTCHNTNDGSIRIQSNATALRWENGSTEPLITGLSPGEYNVTLTDQFGCWLPKSYQVFAPPEIVLDHTEIDPVKCYGGTDGAIHLFPEGGSPPYRLSSSTEFGMALTLNGLETGNYSVEVLDKNQCPAFTELIVPQPDSLWVSLESDSATCSYALDGKALVMPNGGTSPYFFEWNDPEQQTSPRAEGLGRGWYEVTVSDANQCQHFGRIEVLAPPELVIDRVEQDSLNCSDSNDGRARVFPSGGNSGYTFVWNDNNHQTGPQAIGLSKGMFQVTVSDQAGCEVVGEVEVKAPKPILLNAIADSVSCFGGRDGKVNVKASGGGGKFQFYWPDFLIDGPVVEKIPAGSYTVLVRDHKNCVVRQKVDVHEPAPLEVAAVQQILPNCKEGMPGMAKVDIKGGNGGYQYQWNSTNGKDETVMSYNAGMYEVTVTDRKNCRIVVPAEVEGLDLEMSASGAFVNDQLAICAGDELVLDAGANAPLHKIQWRSSQELPCTDCKTIIFEPTDSASYVVEVEDVFGCRDTARIFIPLNRILLDFNIKADFIDSANVLCFGEELTLTALYHPELSDVSWQSNESLSCEDCLTTKSRPQHTSKYILYATAVNGCSAVVEKEVSVSKIKCPQFIPNVFSPNGDGVNDYFYVPASLAGRWMSLKIYNRYGGLMYAVNDCAIGVEQCGWDGTYNGQPLDPAVFVYVILIEEFDGSVSFHKGDVMLLR